MSRKRYFVSIGAGTLAVSLTVLQWGCERAKPPAKPTLPTDRPATRTSAEGAFDATQPSAQSASSATTEVSDVPLGLPPLRVPADNPMTPEKIALGKMLYFDKRLSKDGTISCATCHDPEMAWTEHRPTSEGIGGQVGGANSPTVINAAYAKEQFWDGRAATLEEQALGPIENPIEMGHDLDVLVKELAQIPEYRDGFQKAFGTGVTKEGIAKAIASFERKVLGGNSPYDRAEAGDKDAMTPAQSRGAELFADLNCGTCHAPPLFSNYRYYNAGIGMDKPEPDPGRKSVTGKDGDLGKFRVPPLREVANTAPYFHDGSVATLEEAVGLMAAGGKDNPNLSGMLKALREEEITQPQQKDIVEFLKALSGEYPKKDDL